MPVAFFPSDANIMSKIPAFAELDQLVSLITSSVETIKSQYLALTPDPSSLDLSLDSTNKHPLDLKAVPSPLQDAFRTLQGSCSQLENIVLPPAYTVAIPNSTYGSSGSASDVDAEAEAIDFLFREGSEKGMLIRTATWTVSGGGSGVSGGFSVEETDARSSSADRDWRSVWDGGRDGAVSGETTVGSSGSRRLLRSHRIHRKRGWGWGVGVGVGGTGVTGLSGGFSHLHDTG